MFRAQRVALATSVSLVVLSLPAFAQTVTELPAVVVEAPDAPEGATDGTDIPIVQTSAGPVQGFRALTAESATRTNTPISEIPQSIQVIPRSVIDAQNDLTVSETLQNVSGTQGSNPLQLPAPGFMYVRGFPAEMWIDGLTTFNNGGNGDSLVNVERIEVLKGPNAILYGGGTGSPLGGAVNVVSKMPLDEAFAQFGVTYGSYQFLQPYFDVNTPLNKDGTILFRMTGEYTNADSFVDVIESEKYSINPTVTFTNKDDTSLTIQGRFTSWQQQDYQGLPATGTITGPFRLNPDMYIGPSNTPDATSRVQSVTANFDHEINDIWSVNIQGRVSQTEWNEPMQNYFSTDFAGNAPLPPEYAGGDYPAWYVMNALLHQKQQEATIAGNALAEFDVGITRNKFLVGADYSRISEVASMYYPMLPTGIVNFLDPVYPPYVEPFPGDGLGTVGTDNDNVYTTAGAFVQLQTTIADRIHLLGGLRLANLQIDSNTYDYYSMSSSVQDLSTTDLLPRLGAVVDIVKGFSVYASYTEGLKGNPFTIYNGPPAPERSKQSEAGIKFDLGYGFTGSMAIFEINRTGVPVAVGLYAEPIGEQRSRGFEVDVLWQPNRNWQVLANYSYIDAVLLNDIPGVGEAGNQLNIVPPNSGRLWVNYTFDPGPLHGWSIGAGVYAASGAYVDLANMYETDGYFTVDANISYKKDNFSASLTAKNITGEEYYVPYNYYGGRIAPGEARGIFGKVAWTFK